MEPSTAGDSNRSGGRRIRHDEASMKAAFSSNDAQAPVSSLSTEVPSRDVISIGPVQALVYLDLVREFTSTGLPIPQARRDEIIRGRTSQNPSVIMVALRDVGVIETDGSGTSHALDVMPRTRGIVVMQSKPRRQIWPELATLTAPLPTDEPTVESATESATVPSEKSKQDDRRPDAVRNGPSILHGSGGIFYVPVNAPPVLMSKARVHTYELLMSFYRERNYQPTVSPDLLKRLGLNRNQGYPIIYDLEHHKEVLRLIGDPSKRERVLIFRPYRVLETNEVIVPPECQTSGFSSESSDSPEPVVVSPAVDAPLFELMPDRRLPTVAELEARYTQVQAQIKRIQEQNKQRGEALEIIDQQIDELNSRLAALRIQREQTEASFQQASVSEMEGLTNESSRLSEALELARRLMVLMQP